MTLSVSRHFPIGYCITALLYFSAWVNPRFGVGEKLVNWVAFEKFCLAEFLTCHAITLLAGTAMALAMEGGSKEFQRIYWGLFAFYFIMGSSAYLFHRDNRALIGFYAILITRGVGVLTMHGADLDMMRAEVLKNLLMAVPMMLLIAAISMGEGFGASWQETFIKERLSFFRKIVQGRNLLLVVAYYILWAVVSWKWPLRIADN